MSGGAALGGPEAEEEFKVVRVLPQECVDLTDILNVGATLVAERFCTADWCQCKAHHTDHKQQVKAT